VNEDIIYPVGLWVFACTVAGTESLQHRVGRGMSEWGECPGGKCLIFVYVYTVARVRDYSRSASRTADV